MPYIAVPPVLVNYDQWVCWKGQQKVPYDPVTGKPASTTDPETWSSFMTASKANGYHGIGFVFTTNDPYVGIDLDNCVVGTPNADARRIIDLFNSYTELSQSGTGIHIIVIGKKPGPKCRAGSIEMYDHSRFFIMTGNRLNDTIRVARRQQEINALYKETFPESTTPQPRPRCIPSTQSDTEIVSKLLQSPQYEKFMPLWMGNTCGYPGHCEAYMAMCAILAYWSGDADQIDRIFRKSGLARPKWDQRRGRQTYGEITIANALRG